MTVWKVKTRRHRVNKYNKTTINLWFILCSLTFIHIMLLKIELPTLFSTSYSKTMNFIIKTTITKSGTDLFYRNLHNVRIYVWTKILMIFKNAVVNTSKKLEPYLHLQKSENGKMKYQAWSSEAWFFIRQVVKF